MSCALFWIWTLLAPQARGAQGGSTGGNVTLSGRVEWAGSGPVRVEALTQDEDGQVLELSAVVVTGPGSFELQVPTNSGAVRLRAGSDIAGDGLGPWDPMGIYPGVVQVARRDVEGLSIVLSDPRGRR